MSNIDAVDDKAAVFDANTNSADEKLGKELREEFRDADTRNWTTSRLELWAFYVYYIVRKIAEILYLSLEYASGHAK